MMKNIIKNKRVHKNSLCNFFPKNRRGDIPTIILVIGVFVMCTYAIVSFYLYDNKIKRGVMETNVVETMNSEIEKYSFYKNLGTFTEEQIDNFLGVKTEIKILPSQPGAILEVPGRTLERKYLYVEKTDNNKKIIYIKYYLP